jgi:hypothetical protein
MATSQLKVKATDANKVSNPNALKVTTTVTDDKKKPKKGEKKTPPDDRTLKGDWNKYLKYLEDKGVRGDEKLDKGGLGNQYFLEYIKANPTTTLSVDAIPRIRELYTQLRNTNIEEIKKGKAGFNGKSGPETDFTGFMSHIVKNELSTDPNYVGQHLTKTPFPAMLDYEGKVAIPLYNPKESIGGLKTVDAAIEAKNKMIKQ